MVFQAVGMSPASPPTLGRWRCDGGDKPQRPPARNPHQQDNEQRLNEQQHVAVVFWISQLAFTPMNSKYNSVFPRRLRQLLAQEAAPPNLPSRSGASPACFAPDLQNKIKISRRRAVTLNDKNFQARGTFVSTLLLGVSPPAVTNVSSCAPRGIAAVWQQKRKWKRNGNSEICCSRADTGCIGRAGPAPHAHAQSCIPWDAPTGPLVPG